MNYNGLIIVILLILLSLLFLIRKNERYTNFEQVFGNATSSSNVTEDQLINTSQKMLSKGDIPIVDKGVDDRLITNFIKRQLGKKDDATSGSYDTSTDYLVYPPEVKTEVSHVAPKMLGYTTKLAEQDNKIKTLRYQQDLTLRNLKYELLRIQELQKSIPAIERDEKEMLKNNKKN